MDTIKNLLVPHISSINKSENEMAALVNKIYLIQEQYLEDIINLDWMSQTSQLALVGGIIINCEGKGTDRFLPIRFEVRTKDKTENLFEKAFGMTITNQYLIKD